MNLQKPSDHRKKWDLDEYEKLAAERIEAEQKAYHDKNKKEPPVKRDLLKPREYKVLMHAHEHVYIKGCSQLSTFSQVYKWYAFPDPSPFNFKVYNKNIDLIK